ncbi:MAG: hypothetical protein ABIS35_09070 [Terracoccus sp.]
MRTADASRSGHSWPAFLAWSLVGVGFALGFLSIMTIGLPILIAAVVGTVALMLSRWAKRGVLGLLAGLAVPLLYVAYLNRSGPGVVCSNAGGTTACIDQWSPWPWVAVALVLLVASGLIQARQQP